MTYTYSFECPECGGSWTFEQFAELARRVFSSYDGVGVCPLCSVKFTWTEPGALTSAFTGKRRKKKWTKCRCGCGEYFRTSFRTKRYKNHAHQMRAFRKM